MKHFNYPPDNNKIFNWIKNNLYMKEMKRSQPIDLRKSPLIPTEQFIIPEVYRDDLDSIMVPYGTIKSRVDRMAYEISHKYYSEEIIALCVLKGALKFYHDLFYNEHMWTPFEICTVRCKSYEGTESTGDVNFTGFNFNKVRDKKVIITEDIYDTGRTLNKLLDKMNEFKPQSVEVACLLDKPERRLPGIEWQPDYTGFVIKNEFVVGYGLDFDKKYRGLKHIGVLKEEIYQD
jgi:hypoxanthine phosphoribosyltransferase